MGTFWSKSCVPESGDVTSPRAIDAMKERTRSKAVAQQPRPVAVDTEPRKEENWCLACWSQSCVPPPSPPRKRSNPQPGNNRAGGPDTAKQSQLGNNRNGVPATAKQSTSPRVTTNSVSVTSERNMADGRLSTGKGKEVVEVVQGLNPETSSSRVPEITSARTDCLTSTTTALETHWASCSTMTKPIFRLPSIEVTTSSAGTADITHPVSLAGYSEASSSTNFDSSQPLPLVSDHYDDNSSIPQHEYLKNPAVQTFLGNTPFNLKDLVKQSSVPNIISFCVMSSSSDLLDDATDVIAGGAEGPNVDFEKADQCVNEFKKHAPATGVEELKDACIRFRSRCQAKDKAGCVEALVQLKAEFKALKGRVHPMLVNERGARACEDHY